MAAAAAAAAGGGRGGDGVADGGMNMTPPSSQPGGGSMPMGTGNNDMATMHMSFFWGSRVQILFSNWPGHRGIGMYLLALFLVFATAALVEGFSSTVRRLSQTGTGARRVPLALLLTAVHALQVGLAYLVMLAVMSFNVGVLIAAVAGHALGFLLAGSGLLRRSGPRPNNIGFFVK